MTVGTTRRLYLVAAALVAAMTSCYAIWRYGNGSMPSDHAYRLQGIITGILVVTWLAQNPDVPPNHRPSFDYGFFLWATFPLLATYHLYRTRRWLGIAIIVGLILLFIYARYCRPALCGCGIAVDVPSTVVLRVSCEGTPDLSDLIVGMRISTGWKIPYHIYFSKTDRLRRSVLSEASLRGQFTDHWAAALMDHSGSLENADPTGRLLSLQSGTDEAVFGAHLAVAATSARGGRLEPAPGSDRLLRLVSK